MKNALDAIDSTCEEPFVNIRSFIEANQLIIEVEDSAAKALSAEGLRKYLHRGTVQKKRGWGLGLSLTRSYN